MSKSIKITLISILTAICLTGCMKYELSFHDGSGTIWIEEQLEKGYLTEQQAKLLLEQEAEEAEFEWKQKMTE